MQDIDPTAWIAPSAQLFGMITIGADASVWHNAVMRAELNDIRIGRMTNIQDFVMVHADEQSVVIGTFCSVAHHATLHGCAIEDHSLVGIGATLMDGVLIGRGSMRGRRRVRERGHHRAAGLDRRRDTGPGSCGNATAHARIA